MMELYEATDRILKLYGDVENDHWLNDTFETALSMLDDGQWSEAEQLKIASKLNGYHGPMLD
ncbi:MAG: hypothetical protein L3J67_11580 [Hyphomicrobiaceae bacterium]|nr:hypothetical protein [Hyphomicrobiaceae bacterium]